MNYREDNKKGAQADLGGGRVHKSAEGGPIDHGKMKKNNGKYGINTGAMARG